MTGVELQLLFFALIATATAWLGVRYGGALLGKLFELERAQIDRGVLEGRSTPATGAWNSHWSRMRRPLLVVGGLPVALGMPGAVSALVELASSTGATNIASFLARLPLPAVADEAARFVAVTFVVAGLATIAIVHTISFAVSGKRETNNGK